MTILGSGFTNTTSVKFGPTPAKFQANSDGQITPVSPQGATGKVNVTISTRAGNITGGEFTYVP